MEQLSVYCGSGTATSLGASTTELRDILLRVSANGSEFFLSADGSVAPARGNVGDAEYDYNILYFEEKNMVIITF